MTFQNLRDLISAAGGRRFLMTIGAGVVNSFLVMHGIITSADFVEVTKWTISVFIAGNTIQKVKDVFAPNNKTAGLDYSDSRNSTGRECDA